MTARTPLLVGLVVLAALGCGRVLPRRERERARDADEQPGASDTFRDLSEIYGGDGCGAPKRTGAQTWLFAHQGETWRIPVWIPPGAGPRDGVLLLHGGGGGGDAFTRSSGYDEAARDAGALLVAPDAQRLETQEHGAFKLWKTGRPGTEDLDWRRDDVAFLDAVADRMQGDACVRSVLATGFSDGAAMALTWRCASPRHPDALVLGAGISMQPGARCVDKAPVPARSYVGERDPRYRVGENIFGPEVISVLETTERYARANGCADRFEDGRDGACRAYRGCEAAVELCVVDGLGHAWPHPPHGREDATRDGLRWFQAHHR